MTAIAPQVDKPILISFSNVVGEYTQKDLVAEILKMRAEERLAGNVAVEVEGLEIFMPSAGELA